jgi:pyrroline-5-carboxylate reductase
MLRSGTLELRLNRTVLLAGCGNMGFAMLQGWLALKALAPTDVQVVEPSEPLRSRAAALGVRAVESVDEVSALPAPGLVVLAVKPQVMGDVLPSYVKFSQAGSAFLSIAAGIGTPFMAQRLGAETPIIRCMPNTPAAIGKGMLVYCKNTLVSAECEAFVRSLLTASGRVARVEDESLIDAVTAVSGSGPAYVFHFIECLTDAGVSAGLPQEIAAELAMQTAMGASALAAESSDTPAKLREQVTSPNGTTAAALAVLMRDGALKKLVGKAVEAARRRSVELGGP